MSQAWKLYSLKPLHTCSIIIYSSIPTEQFMRAYIQCMYYVHIIIIIDLLFIAINFFQTQIYNLVSKQYLYSVQTIFKLLET